MLTLVTDAPVVVQESVDVLPDEMLCGAAVNETMQALPMSNERLKVP